MNNVNWLDYANAIGSIATAIALIIAICQFKDAKKQIKTDFEDDLDREYREIIRNLPIKIFLGEDLSPSEYQESLAYLYQYIDLSNSQVFYRQIGRVSDDTWRYWNDGIKSNLSKKPFKTAWLEVKEKGQQSFSELKRLENSTFQNDPKDWK
jgi:hypothetical protein